MTHSLNGLLIKNLPFNSPLWISVDSLSHNFSHKPKIIWIVDSRGLETNNYRYRYITVEGPNLD